MVEVIRLGTQPFNNDIIRLGSGKKKSKFKKTITSVLTKTAVLEAGILGSLLGGPFGGIKAGALTGIGLGILQTSPKAAKFVGEKIKDPTAGGRFIGEQIEKIGQTPLPTEKGLGEKIKEGLKKAGVLGGVVAAGVGAGALIKKGVEKVKKTKVPTIAAIPTGILTQPTLSQLPQQVAPQIQPLGVAQKVIEEETPKAVTPIPTIKNTQVAKPRPASEDRD